MTESLYELNGKPIGTLISAEKLEERIAELGKQITADFQGKDLIVIGVLRGCFMFLTDLVRQIDLPLVVDFLGLSSYGGRTESSGVVRVTSDLSTNILDKDVLIIEDIVDTGLTMSYLMENMSTRKPRSLKVCTLLEKPDRNIKPCNLDYVGFTIPDEFVIGYGLDYDDKYRNLPYIGVVDGLGKE